MRSAVGLKAHHVVCCYLAPEDGIVPVLQHEKLVVVQHVGGTCDVPRDEDAISHDPVKVEGAAARITGNAPKATCKASTLQPFRVADGTKRRHHHLDVESRPVGESGTSHVSSRITFQCLDRDARAEVHSVIPLHLGSDVADDATESADQWSLGTLGDGHSETELTTDRGHLRADEAGADDQDPTRLGR